LGKLAHYDFLTGACNRRYGFEFLKRQAKIALRNKTSFLLAYVDLDHLKEINDQFGHKEGDRAIKKLVNLFRSTLRDVDIIIRMGGDEFLLVFPESSLKDMFIIKKRLYHQLGLKNQVSKRPYDISFSIGFSYYNPNSPWPLNELIRLADKRMYKNKRKKKYKIN
jgi:diguanylate cyclase (GGDEF)-like protein